MSRINLLPEEVLERRRNRQQSLMLAVYFGIFLLVLVGVWLVRNGQLNAQEERRDRALAQVATLQTKIAALEEFARLDQTVKAKAAVLATAMSDDVAWSRLLIEVSMIIPGDSWLTSFNGVAVPASAAAAATPVGPKSLGNLTFSVVTFDFRGVAEWITRFEGLRSLQNIWVPSATKGTIGTRDVVNYSSTADLSVGAATSRYQSGPPS
ncbi:MAG TPA: hypothetical protein VI541_02070 [Actinomycetota bacterium]|nr:hypothetical protein [Actinomycetota bacterium]